MRWEERIENARTRGHFTPKDQRMADRWTTCACGEQDVSLHTDNNPTLAPWDAELRELGCVFPVKVATNKFDEALGILQRIQNRAGLLLSWQKELEARPNLWLVEYEAELAALKKSFSKELQDAAAKTPEKTLA